MPRLGITGPRAFPLALLVGRWWLRRCPRCLARAIQVQQVQAEQKIDQLRLCQPLDFLAFLG